MHRQPDAKLIEALEADRRLCGKRTADVPRLADFRIKFRSRFYRLADFGMFLSIFGAILALSANNPVWWLSAISTFMALGVVYFAESKAQTMTRQLHRRAAEQLARDLLEIRD